MSITVKAKNIDFKKCASCRALRTVIDDNAGILAKAIEKIKGQQREIDNLEKITVVSGESYRNG